MLIRIPKSHSFVTRSPVGLPVYQAGQASSQFNGIYLRPNLLGSWVLNMLIS